MLYYIDKATDNFIKKEELSESEAAFFTQLAIAHQKGQCILCGYLDTITFLGNKLGPPASGIYKSILGRYAEQKSLIETVGYIVVISFCDDGREISQLPEVITAREHIIIPVDKAIKLKIDRECALVAENLTDCDFYEIIGKYYCREKNIRGIKVCLNHIHGGGDTLADVYRKSVCDDHIPTLCFADTDMKYGRLNDTDEIPYGKTLLRAQEVDRNIKDITPHFLYVLEVHEAENLIPHHVIKTVDGKAKVDILTKLETIRCGEPAFVYDLKQGIIISDNKSYNDYWIDIFKVYHAESPQILSSYDLNNLKVGTVLFPPISTRSTRKLLKCSVEKMKNDASIVHTEGQIHKHWLNIGKTILKWGCAMEPLRV